MNDKTSPIIFQGADVGEYDAIPTLSAFVTRVKALPLTHDALGRTRFTSLSGSTLEICADSVEIPKINGTAVDLVPSTMPLYEAPPFLTAEYGEAVFEVHMDGHDSARLDFSGPMH